VRVTTVEAVYTFWEANLNSFAALPRTERDDDVDPVKRIGSALKERVRNASRRDNGKTSEGGPLTDEHATMSNKASLYETDHPT
jgi:hypothetical protein